MVVHEYHGHTLWSLHEARLLYKHESHTHLVNKFSPLVRNVYLWSSKMTDQVIHELCNTLSEFSLQSSGLNPLAGIVYSCDNGVVALWSFWQIGDEINAKLVHSLVWS